MHKQLIYLTVLLLFSCSKEIEVDFPQESKSVVTSIFKPKEHFIFYHSMSNTLSKCYPDTLTPYELKLYKNEQLILDTILNTSPYESNIYPRTGEKYTLQLIKESYPTLSATDSIPETMPYIKEAQRIFPTGRSDYGEEYCDIVVTFKDPENEENYYEIIVINSDKYTNDSFNEFSPTDIAWKNEGDYAYWPGTIFFSDALFNGEEYTFRQKYYNNGDSVILRTVSKAYFLYRKYYTRHNYNQQKQSDFFDVFTKGEPQNMYSNVTNGYGNFAAYQESTCPLEIIEIK